MSPTAILSLAASPTSTAHSTQTWFSEAVCPGFYSPIYSSPPATTVTFEKLACAVLGLPSGPRPRAPACVDFHRTLFSWASPAVPFTIQALALSPLLTDAPPGLLAPQTHSRSTWTPGGSEWHSQVGCGFVVIYSGF